MNNPLTNVNFRLVQKNGTDIRLLFDLLSARIHNISHEQIPEFNDHAYFVMNSPYRAWYFVFDEGSTLGTFYIKNDNSIGINLINSNLRIISKIICYIKLHYVPRKAIRSMVPSFFYVNLPSSASTAHSILCELGYDEIQRSYRL